MAAITLLYYVMSACLVVILGVNFVRERQRANDALLYLVVMVPFVLRLLQVK